MSKKINSAPASGPAGPHSRAGGQDAKHHSCQDLRREAEVPHPLPPKMFEFSIVYGDFPLFLWENHHYVAG